MCSGNIQNVFLKDYAYIRGGAYASQNWIDINNKINRTSLVLKTSPDDSLNRRILLKFDISFSSVSCRLPNMFTVVRFQEGDIKQI